MAYFVYWYYVLSGAMLEAVRRAYPLVELFRAFKVENTCKIGLYGQMLM